MQIKFPCLVEPLFKTLIFSIATSDERISLKCIPNSQQHNQYLTFNMVKSHIIVEVQVTDDGRPDLELHECLFTDVTTVEHIAT